jgi:hypothetical protein
MGKTRRNAAKIVSAAIIGLDGETVVIAGRAYHILPPTIKRLAQAAFYLSDMEEAETLRGLLMSVGNPEPLCNALSCLIRGDESLRDELMEGTMDEVAEAMEVAYSLASVENFWKLSALARNVASLTARQRL